MYAKKTTVRKTYKPRYVKKYRPTRPLQTASKTEFKKALIAPTVACDSTGTITLLNGLTRGDDEGDRDGRRTNVKSINMRGVTTVTAGTGTDQLHRIMLVRYLRPNGTAPVITDILQSNTVYSLRNRQKIGDFQVLYDRVYQLNASAESGSQKFLKYYKRMNTEVQYNAGNAGTIADIEKNALYLITLGSNAAGATAGTFTGNVMVQWLE